MRKTFLTAAVACVVAVVVALLAACKAQDNAPGLASSPPPNAEAAPTQAALQSDGARRVTVQELQDLLAKNEAIVVDVRPKEQYAQGHIKGALSITSGEIASSGAALPKDKLIVLYCA